MEASSADAGRESMALDGWRAATMLTAGGARSFGASPPGYVQPLVVGTTVREGSNADRA
jgi:hypothetical protein